MDLKDIKAIIDLMKKNSVSEFELEKQDFKIGSSAAPTAERRLVTDDDPRLSPMPPPAALPPRRRSRSAAASAGLHSELEIKSPMIGTFYRAPSPESGTYVEVGTEVNPDTVVCIIEAMKVMNEIKAEAKGVITQVLVENAKPVEFGQPLFKIRPT